MTGVRVLLVEDQELVRTGLRMVVDSQPDLTVVGEAADGLAGVREARRLRPDVVLMDVRMPVLDGIEATRRVVALPGPPKVVVLTTYDLDEHALAAIRAGAAGFLLKDAPAEDLLRALRAVHAGDAVIAASTTRRLLDHLAPALDPAAVQAVAALTGREREVLVAMARGRPNAEIAALLSVAEGTVKTHVGNILAKLHVRNRVQAVVTAYEAGLVRPGDR
ncbi:response regulator transcription factor [Actinosynnema sp. NPDC047251]|uniref:CheY-like receiver domain/HTH DNA-binding domain-containing response regulator n=1 Tax=Saccharothrix espanaensis (strain ATCC 51144 / DSM 44229 / JCM 9112 / NBRC 15066 / NRRL 15764) TaxID=1179773 RepID=K0K9T4_SACES|nr:response regulator transcription factor [Saccharothrix espanaensis]CCH33398.1 CheY-like receiver domain/HTH DNA-binding domain-containing response regulator [Saccharothrix espanaensis DSM 44229]